MSSARQALKSSVDVHQRMTTGINLSPQDIADDQRVVTGNHPCAGSHHHPGQHVIQQR